MRGVVQRVSLSFGRGAAADGPSTTRSAGSGPGLCVLVGVTHDDDDAAANKLADKVWNLRIFADDDRRDEPLGRRRRALEVLVVSQFTLYGDTRKGRRPSFVAAARPERRRAAGRRGGRRAPAARRDRGDRPVPHRHGGVARQRRPGHRCWLET